MILGEKNEFLKESLEGLEYIYNSLSNVESIGMKDLDENKTVLVIVDVINGFIKEGQMADRRIENIIEPIVELKQECDKKGIKTIAFADCHDEEAVEFLSYPQHCIKNSSESEVVDELKSAGVDYIIEKNSTNGFIEQAFIEWLENNSKINNFIVVGDCTDICVQQFAITLKTWFNMKNKQSNIMVPLNAIETYDANFHNARLTNAVSAYNMMQNGIKIIKSIVRSKK